MNAVHAWGGEGRIVLTTCLNKKRQVELKISDNGPGIDLENQKQIFAPFFTTKPEGEGTGLGLYICQNIIREHGGKIMLKSAPGEGATFTICLPAE